MRLVRVIAFAMFLIALVAIGDTASTVTAQDALAAPTGISAMETGSGQVTISWNPVDNAQFYRIGWVVYDDVAPTIAAGGDWLEHFAFIDVSNRGQTQHTISRMTPGERHAFIVASNSSRYGTPSWPSADGWSFLTVPADAGTPSELGSGSINLTWEEVPGAAYYRIGWVVYSDVQPIIAAGGEWLEHFAFIDIANRGQTEHTIGRLTPGLRYAFIVAGNDGRYGTPQWPPASAWQFLTPSAGPPVPEPSTDANTDRATLVALYNATGGANWTNNEGWLAAGPMGDWFGVSTDDNGRVTSLGGADNGLTGTLPSSLGNLSRLEVLSLFDNQLTGPIPPELANLSNLTRLHLDQNGLTGSIPAGLGDLSNLNRLTLNENRLTGQIPAQLGSLTNLTTLSLSGNQFSGCIPAGLQSVPTNDFDKLDLPFCAPGVAPAETVDETIVFGYPTWDSIQIQTRIAQYIVERGYGYRTETADGSTLALIAALRRGDVDVLMELWLPRQDERWNEALNDGTAVRLGTSFGDHWQSAFVIPDYLQEQYPGLDNVEDLKNPRYRSLFATATSDGKAHLVSCVRSWDCAGDNDAQVEGYSLSNHVEIFNPSSSDALDASLLNAYTNREPWLGFQWATNRVALRLDLVRLSEPPYSDRCWNTTKSCGYEEDTIVIAGSSAVPASVPDISAMLGKWNFDVDTVYKEIARWRFDNADADINATALWWLNNRGSIWSQWVTDEAAASIQSALNSGEIPAGWE